MTNPTTYGQPLVQPDDVVSRIDSLIPADEVHSHPLVWRARNIDLALLIDARNEIKRLRAGGCARNQGLKQHCAEAAAAHAEHERLRDQAAALWEAFGVLTTLAPKMEIDASDPVGMALKIEATVRAALEAKP
jgi:cobalamin biosynthesis protein CobD/CbiB